MAEPNRSTQEAGKNQEPRTGSQTGGGTGTGTEHREGAAHTQGAPGSAPGSMASGAGAQQAREQSSRTNWGSEGQSGQSTVQRGMEAGSEMMGQARQSMSQAYDRASRGMTDTWEQAMDYSRQNPGTATLVALGAGIGIGVLLASGMASRSRTRRIVPPVMNALSEIASELFR